jgi:L-ascorbate metabolism protein UlaG (beta-lactamase superfamily)
MKRRQFLRDAGAGFAAAVGLGMLSKGQIAQAQTSSVSIQWLGHTCFLFSGSGRRILVNPFRPIGCTEGYRAPTVSADLVMISSRLLDEGVFEGLPGDPRVLTESGIYEFSNMQVQGIQSDHDRVGGVQFGTNIMWLWNQGGLKLLHMGGIAGEITVEQQILIGRPDVVFIPVGGGPKAYTAAEAVDAINVLNPKIIVPTHYLTDAADDQTCDITPVDDFLTLMEGTPVTRRSGDSMSLSTADLPESGAKIEVLTYSF